MPTDITTVDPITGDLVVHRSGMALRIGLHDLFHDLDADARMAVAAAVTWDAVLAEALRRLAYESDSWCSSDVRTREEWLLAIGAVHEERIKDAERSRDEAWARTRLVEEAARRTAATIAAHAAQHENGLPPCCRADVERFRDIDGVVKTEERRRADDLQRGGDRW